jgi:uncharacterized protein
MQLSRYCKVYPKEDDSETFIIFSTKEASIIEANRAYIENIHKNRLPKKEKRELLGLGIIVDDLDKEKNEMLRYIDEINSINNIFRANVAVNLDCNLACRYCFEGLRKGIKDFTKSHNLDNWKNDKCLDCSYLPLCFGCLQIYEACERG